MRTILIKSLLVIMFFLTIILIILGLRNESFFIESFVSLQQKTAKLNSEVYDLQEKNTSEYKSKQQDLIDAVSEYRKNKLEYEKTINLIKSVGSKEYEFDLYDIDFLWTIIGNYATEEGVELKFDVSNISEDSLISNTDFVLCNLNFTVIGEYLSIINFIYDLEEDERLNFEINDFTMKKQGKKIQAMFLIKSIPLNNTNLSIIDKTL